MNNRFKTYIRKCIVILLTLPLGGVGGGLLSSCSDSDSVSVDVPVNVINVGGVNTDEMIVTAEVSSRGSELETSVKIPAEEEKWLIQPLKKGLDITYGKYSSSSDEKSQERVAILKLLATNPAEGKEYNVSEGGLAEYSFNYRDDTGAETNDAAVWHDNGYHYFEGVHVPNRLRFNTNVSELESDNRTINSEKVKATINLTSDQHDGTETGSNDDLGNYTLLTHYLGMPASTHIAATVSRILLPFQHRLSRVLVHVLIDPNLSSATKIYGYKSSTAEQSAGIEDATTSSIRFCNVDVLEGVKDVYDETKKVHTLTPKWKNQRKVIPHFIGENGTYNKEGKLLNEDFLMYQTVDKKTNIYGTSDLWASAHNAYTTAYDAATGTDIEKKAEAEKKSGYRQYNYGKAPLYDVIVRPTYTTTDKVMYDEDLTGTTKDQLVALKNSIDFDISLNIGLQYEKNFEFDLDANQETVVYLRISREEIDYDASGAEKWVETKYKDDWYGLDNANGNTLSVSGSSWQRAFTHGKTIGGQITDGGYYDEATPTQEDGTAGQYLKEATWKKYFAQAYKGGAHHGDYFILENDITIDASELPADFVFTGHLDGRDHTITFTGGNSDVYDLVTSNYPATGLYYKKASSDSWIDFTLPTLYICEEVAQAKSRAEETIPAGGGKMTPVSVTLNDIMNNEVVYYIKNDNGSYSVYDPRTWLYATKRTGAGSLFCGIDGNYPTAQEEAADPYASSVVWEANVHKETNNGKEHWVPTKGWRAEVLNVKVKTGTLFPAEYTFTDSGNVRNSYDVNSDGTRVKTYTNTPSLPLYK